jgi:Tfp pilus assembly protein PilO
MTQRDRIMISVVLLVVLLGGYWMLLLSPKRKAAAAATTKLTAARQTLDDAQSKLTTGQQAQARFRNDRATVVRLGRVVPTSDDAATVLVQLQQIGKETGVDFVSYEINGSAAAASASTTTSDPTPTTPTQTDTGTGSTAAVAPLYAPGSAQISGNLARTPIQLTLNAPYFKLEKFLRAVQRFAVISSDQTRAKGRLMIVDGVGFAPYTAPGVPKGTLQATVVASTYYAPAIASPTDPSSGTATATTPTAAPATGASTAAIGSLR